MDVYIVEDLDERLDVELKVGCGNKVRKCEGGASIGSPPIADNELTTPVKLRVTHSIQNESWRDVQRRTSLHNNP